MPVQEPEDGTDGTDEKDEFLDTDAKDEFLEGVPSLGVDKFLDGSLGVDGGGLDDEELL